MTKRPRIKVQIERITGATDGLSRAALEQALRTEVTKVVAREGAGAFGPGGARARASAAVDGSTATGRDRMAGLAAATIKAVRS